MAVLMEWVGLCTKFDVRKATKRYVIHEFKKKCLQHIVETF